jgi:hypothetical protein
MSKQLRMSPSLRRALFGAGAMIWVWSVAALAPAAKGPQLSLVKSVASDGGSALEDGAHAVIVQGANYFVAGYKSGATNGRNASADKCTSNLAWDGGYTFDGYPNLDDEYDDVAVNSRGEIYFAGYSNQNGRGRDVFIQKFLKNMKGTRESAYYDAIGGDDQAHGIAVATDRTVYVTGEVTEPRSGTNVWLGKYDSNLAYITSGSHGSPDVAGDGANDAGRAIAIDSSGNLIVAGTVVRAGTGNDLWVGKFDKDLHFIQEAWVAGDGSGFDSAYALVIDKKHRIWVAGSVGVAGQGRDIWLGGFDADLAPLGSVTRSGPTTGDDDAFSVATDNKGHLFVGGRTATPGGATAPWVGVFDTHMNFVTETTYTDGVATTGDHDGAYHIALLPANALLVVGGTTTTAGGGDVWMARYKALRLPVVRKP